MTKKIWSKSLSPLIAATLAVGVILGLASTPSVAGEMKLRLTFPTDVTTFELPYFVPQDQGWYKEQGLEVEEIWVKGDANALRTVLAGDSDICIIGVPTLLNAVIEGAQVVGIGSWQPVVDYQIVGKKGVVSKLTDLSGKILSSAAPGGLTTELPKMVLKKHGIDPGTVTFLQVGGHSSRLKAVVAGKTQAAMINTFTATKGKMDGEVEIITALASEFPGLGYVLLVANKSALADANMRKALEIFVEGNARGARYIMENPDGAAEILKKRNPDMDEALLKSVIRQLNSIKVWGVNGGADKDVVGYTANLSAELKMVKRKVEVSEVLDSSIADKIVERIGKY